ncbi:IclR family transcriptional regulator [Paracandidimonas soli]|uniref:IclR family transcriptional regulator n=1 Tax=Paracandidimonas soli TaxID=1917182 RepID=A0A4R3VG18_9BURK|nr:IclR family transcriptional regulator [Paracandidimonas soli]TCV02684.1 IclR family transcriptional regulator [Paracandidimonas soli]
MTLTQNTSVPGAQSVTRVLRLLKLIGSAPARGAGLSDLARDAGLTQPTTHRMLAALQQEGFVSLHPTLKTYTLGREAYVLGLAAERRHGLKEIAEAGLQRIAMETGDTAFLSIRSGDDAVCIDRKVGDFPIKILTLDAGHRRPLGIGAGSLALLSSLSDPEIEQILQRHQQLPSPLRIDLDTLRQDIALTRRNGYATNPGRIISDMAGIGIAVFDRKQNLCASLSVAAIRSRLSGQQLQHALSILKREALQLSQDLSRS